MYCDSDKNFVPISKVCELVPSEMLATMLVVGAAGAGTEGGKNYRWQQNAAR